MGGIQLTMLRKGYPEIDICLVVPMLLWEQRQHPREWFQWNQSRQPDHCLQIGLDVIAHYRIFVALLQGRREDSVYLREAIQTKSVILTAILCGIFAKDQRRTKNACVTR